ncbi:MAG: hypothetical protein JWN87_541, partial [Frankiales bacterium]|nr:hypothetical protein [Frankiales bacterium]
GLFRRKAGKHELGAAVPVVPAQAPPVAVPYVAPAPEPAPVAAARVDAPYQPVPARGMRVELGFRDGSTAALAPGSAQAKALTDLASALTKRD